MPTREEFNDWYNEIVERLELTDKRYPIKGMNVWRPYGWKLMRNIDSLIRQEFDSTGHEEVLFPLLIPKDQFAKEAEHIKGFDAEVYWVTHAGLNELDVPLLLRPTSETAMYPMFSLWVRAHTDLPLKIYQLVNTFRYETKQTRAFIRVREIHFFESHTCHVDFEDAEKQVDEDTEILRRFARKLCIPYLLCKRPDWDKFAGAYYTLGIDALMPNGKALQIGSIHQYKENFSRPYDIKYEDENGEHRYVHQTTFGMSERLVGTIIGVHSDDKGIIIPPAVAPYQVVIVPIISKKGAEEVMAAATELRNELSSSGIRVHLDDRDLRPGNKYYHWEERGVPLRVEIGLRDIEKNSVVLVRRDTGEKSFVPREELIGAVWDAMDAMEKNLWDRAERRLRENILIVDSIDDIAVSEDDDTASGIYSLPWCGLEECAHAIEDRTGFGLLGVPSDRGNKEYAGSHEGKKCAVCGKDAVSMVMAAKSM